MPVKDKKEAAHKDIHKPKDIQRVINAFFRKVKKDKLLAPFFADKTKADWDAFLPVMYSFWENALFYSGNYMGNPMQRHSEMNETHAFAAEHYARWLELFAASIDERYAGEKAELMKERSRNISVIMQVKMQEKKKAG
jgi:hemoglobin